MDWTDSERDWQLSQLIMWKSTFPHFTGVNVSGPPMGSVEFAPSKNESDLSLSLQETIS